MLQKLDIGGKPLGAHSAVRSQTCQAG